MSYWISII